MAEVEEEVEEEKDKVKETEEKKHDIELNLSYLLDKLFVDTWNENLTSEDREWYKRDFEKKRRIED